MNTTPRYRSPTVETARCAIAAHENGLRATGRSTAMLAQLQDGDAFICPFTLSEWASAQLRARGCRASVLIAGSPAQVWEVMRRRAGCGGAIYIDHFLQSALIDDALNRMAATLARLASGGAVPAGGAVNAAWYGSDPANAPAKAG